ncbi:glycosyltransferase family 4 protein [Baaleninema sp.]|uniref:glycosyltransferase family 4 protein n=1 Tax=Baaleninema sp. TaxID=3101197 RepID=UPI003D087574
MNNSLNLLFLSTPVGALGTGLGGGVELSLYNIAQALQERGHRVKVLAPEGSQLPPLDISTVTGALQVVAQTQERNAAIALPKNPVLGAMWEEARRQQDRFDLIFNFAYDWLPFFLTPFFQTPVVHLVSMGSITDAMDAAVLEAIARYPQRIAFYTRTQAATFGEVPETCPCLGSGIDLSLYEFCETPGDRLAWVGRIAPEKGLEDAVAAVAKTGIPLTVWGKMQFPDYWEEVLGNYPDAEVEYAGFLPTRELQRQLGRCRGFLMTPKWVEAFGNVTIEALACGVPVISYRRGGPTEIVREGETGFLVEPDSVEGLVSAIDRLPEIDRANCRRQAETEFSIPAMGDRVETWLRGVLKSD